MKTKAQILQAIKTWFKMGEEQVKFYENDIAKSIVIERKIWTQYCHKFIVGDNEFTILANSKGTYPNAGPVLSICIYYEE